MIKHLLILTAFFISTELYCSSPECRVISYTNYSQFPISSPQKPSGLFSKYFNSLIVGGLVGAASGAICFAAESKFGPISMLITWPLFSALRATLIDTISDDFDHYGVRYNPRLMAGIAQLSDWAAYVALWYKVIQQLAQDPHFRGIRS